MNRIIFVLLLINFFCFISGSGSAQYYFRHYQTDDGLAHNRVNVIVQDSKGLMWMGSRDGLNRFDGYNFKVCRNAKSQFGNIGDNNVTSIAEDHHGMLWVGTGLGLYKYDPFKEEFTELDDGPLVKISHILIDKQNNLWFIAGSKLYHYVQSTKILTYTGLNASCVSFDQQMNLWLGNHFGIVRVYNPQLKLILSFPAVGKQVPLNSRSISKIYVNGNDVLIGCFEQGLKKYDRATRQVSALIPGDNGGSGVYVRDIVAEADYKYWIATEKGIYVYDEADPKKKVLLNHRAGDPFSLSATAAYTVYKDRDGGMWAGTYFGGINYYSNQNSRFEKYYPVPDSNSISGLGVREISADKAQQLWIGTEDAGLNKLNVKTGRFTHFTANGKRTDLSYPNVHGILAVGDKLLISTFFHGLEIMDIPTGRITERYPVLDTTEPRMSNFIFRIYATRNGSILVGTKGAGSGMFIFNQKTKRFKRIEAIPRNSMVNDIIEDSHGNIWTASATQGVYIYKPGTGYRRNLRFGNRINTKTNTEFAVYGLFEDSDHFMWFMTEGGGLIRLSPDGTTIRKFTTKNGLPSNILFRMLEDDRKRLWVSSSKGLVCLDMRSAKMTVYTTDNGLLTDQFNYNSAFKDNAGKMYFGSIKGMVAFNPTLFGKTEQAPSTYITGFQINNQEVVPGKDKSPLTKSIVYTDSIALRYDQNTFSLEFAALNYSSAKATKYKYMVAGLSSGWTYLESNRKVYFTDLAPGEYTFKVQAKSNLGVWEGTERRIFIKISPPFWKNSFAYLSYILLTVICLYFVIYFYHQQQLRKNRNKQRLFEHQKEKEIYQAKIEFFTNVAHEIKSPLTLILGPIEWILQKVGKQPFITRNLLMVQESAERLQELANQLLDFRKTERDQFGLSFVNVNITKLVNEQFGRYRLEILNSGLDATIKVPDADIIAFVDREVFTKIFTNLLSNAVKYAATWLRVELTGTSQGDRLSIKFINDGKGIPADLKDRVFEPFFRLRSSSNKPGTGIGLSLARSLTELHNGTLELTSGSADAIIFELTLPVHQSIEFVLKEWKQIN